MDLAADIEARLARIFAVVERIEEDRQDEIRQAGEDTGVGTLGVETLAKFTLKKSKTNQAPGVMNLGATTHSLRCHLSLAQ